MGESFRHVSEHMGELIESFFTTPIFGDTAVGFTVTMFYFMLSCIILFIVVLRYTKKVQEDLVPHGPFVNGVEYIVEFVRNDICRGTLPDTWRQHFPFLATVFFVVLFHNYIGMLPTWKAGTATTGVTGAIALMSFCYFIYVGCKKKGVFGYIKSLAPEGLPAPVAVLVWVIEVFSTFLRLVTLAVRLFCNMFAGHVAMGVFALACTIFVQPLLQNVSAATLGLASMDILWMVLLILIYGVELMVAFIQAYIFTLLSAVYVQLAEAEGH